MSDDFHFGRAAAPTPNAVRGSSDSDGFAYGGVSSIAAADSVPPVKRRRTARARAASSMLTTAKICVFLVVDTSFKEHAQSHVYHRFATSQDSIPHYDGLELAIIGICILAYFMRRANANAATQDLAMLEREARRRRRSIHGGCLGYIDYTCDDVYLLDEPYVLHDKGELDDVFSCLSWCKDLAFIDFSGATLGSHCQKHGVPEPLTAVSVSMEHGELLAKGLTKAVRVVGVSQQNYRRDFIRDFPKYSSVRAWARSMTTELPEGDRNAGRRRVGAMLDLPAGTAENPQSQRFGRNQADRPQYDAVHMLKWLRFSRHLHSTENTTEAIDDGIDAAVDDAELFHEVKARRNKVPEKTLLQRSRVRMDAAGMNMERRFFRNLIENEPESIVSIHLYSDASPVSGSELQGMLVDLFYLSGAVTTHVLPGVALAYGAYGLYSKAFAFLWSLFLIMGPWQFGLQWFCDKIASITSDMGTEIGLLDCPNLIPIFLLFISGTKLADLVPQVDLSSRLFKNAIRISGWSHLLGNLMYLGRRATPRHKKYKQNSLIFEMNPF